MFLNFIGVYRAISGSIFLKSEHKKEYLSKEALFLVQNAAVGYVLVAIISMQSSVLYRFLMTCDELGDSFCEAWTGFTLALLLLEFREVGLFWCRQFRLARHCNYCNHHKWSFLASTLRLYYGIRGRIMVK